MRQQLLQHVTRIADKCGIYRNVLVDFCAIDFDVNFTSAFRVGAQIAGHAVIKTHTDGDQEVGFLNGVIDPGFAVHAHHAEIEGIIGREAADTEKCHGYVELAGANELIEGAHRAGNHDAMAGED